jgi:uncharacterized protein YbjT (DUF2867 family)
VTTRIVFSVTFPKKPYTFPTLHSIIFAAMKNHSFSVTLFGASGLVGNQLLQKLIQHPGCSLIQIPVRKSLDFQHPKVREVIFSFEPSEYHALSPTDVVVCAVGTTQKKVKGDQNAYRKIDFDIAVHAAQWAENSGCRQFQLISAIGANAHSGNFYTRLKGEIENRILETKISQIIVFRPSLLIGKRNEKRWAEGIGQWLLPLISFLLPQKYQPIKATDLAQEMMRKMGLIQDNSTFKILWEKGWKA